VPQLSEQDQSVASDVEPGDDPAGLVPVNVDNTARDSHDGEPRGLNVHDDQLETIPGGFSVDSPVQDNDSDPKCYVVVLTTSRLHSFSKILAVNVQLFRSPEFAMPFVFIHRMLGKIKGNILCTGTSQLGDD
jgi:hypothetical protein